MDLFKRRASARKRRLFCAGFCRLNNKNIRGNTLVHRVQMIEQLADGLLTSEQVDFDDVVCQCRQDRESGLSSIDCVDASYTGLRPDGAFIPQTARNDPARRLQRNLTRELLGNPFRPVSVRRDWLTWNDGTVPKLAQTIYDDRRFDIMPILADALEEAGCGDTDILSHCRGLGPHVRGCW